MSAKHVQVIDSTEVPFRTPILRRKKARTGWQARCSCGWESDVVEARLLFAMYEVEMYRDYHRFDHIGDGRDR